jgi:hypothetical protein
MNIESLLAENDGLADQIKYLLKENRRLCEWIRASKLPFAADPEEVIMNAGWHVGATVAKEPGQ